MRIRLLPVFIFVAAMLLTLKVGTIWHGLSSVRGGVQINIARAAERDSDRPPAPAQAPEKAPTDAASAKVEAVKAGAASDTGAQPAEAQGDPKTASAAGVAVSQPASGDKYVDPQRMSRSEIRLLQALAGRRQVLDQREQSLNQREALLEAAAQQLVDKQTQLVTMRREVEGLLNQLDEKEKKRISNLVKIYESMKPKRAANIFNELEMPVLLGVVERMKARKLAPVIAAMKADKARTVTRALAQRQRDTVTDAEMAASVAPRPK